MTDPAGKDGDALVFAEDFTGGVLDDTRWVAHYLPQWTTPDRSAAPCGSPTSRPGPAARRSAWASKAHHDPRLRDDMTDLQLELDATDWHTYAAAWDAHQTRFSIDDQFVRTIPRVTGGWHEIRADG